MRKNIIFICAVAFSTLAFSQKKPFDKVSIDAFISETQFGSDSQNDVDLIWWIPTEYWNAIFAQDPSTSQSEKDIIISMLKDLAVVIVIKGKVGVFGGITYDTKENIKAITSISYKGEKLKMASEDEIDPDVLNFMSIIKPMMKNMLGSMGENMQMFIFENPKDKAVLPIDPYSDNELKFTLGTLERNVSLPLSCLLEEKICTEDNSEWNGKWNFCPIHGTKLSQKE